MASVGPEMPSFGAPSVFGERIGRVVDKSKGCGPSPLLLQNGHSNHVIGICP
jgi:hypothetical protein